MKTTANKHAAQTPKQGEQIVQEKLDAARAFLKNADLTLVYDSLAKSPKQKV